MATMTSTAMTTLLHNQENMSGQSRDAMGLMHKEGALINIALPDNIPYPKYESPGRIGYQVHVNLERKKDIQRHKRVELAHDVKRILEQEFGNAGYTSHDTVPQKPIKAMLFVDVAIASDGNYYGRKLCGDFFVGGAKLVLVWCLQSLDTQDILMGHRSVMIDTVAMGGGPWAVKNIAYKMVDEIVKLVNMTCHNRRQYLGKSVRSAPILGFSKSSSDSRLDLI
jgi:hypothetical protein